MQNSGCPGARGGSDGMQETLVRQRIQDTALGGDLALQGCMHCTLRQRPGAGVAGRIPEGAQQVHRDEGFTMAVGGTAWATPS